MVPPRIVDPHAVPVAGYDHHLEPIAPQRLSVDALRERFRADAVFEAPIRGDGGASEGRAAAAVLVGLVPREDGVHVLLTRRTEHLRDHAGQISFPGGRAEAHDADAVATALRETEEEVGLAAGLVDVLGTLPGYTTITSYLVTPVVALVQPTFTVRPDTFEVAEVFEVPLQFLMTPTHHRRHEFEYLGQPRRFLSMPWQGVAADGQPREYFIWGATAAMIRNLYGFLRG